jgi:hypothetical protein
MQSKRLFPKRAEPHDKCGWEFKESRHGQDQDSEGIAGRSRWGAGRRRGLAGGLGPMLQRQLQVRLHRAQVHLRWAQICPSRVPLRQADRIRRAPRIRGQNGLRGSAGAPEAACGSEPQPPLLPADAPGGPLPELSQASGVPRILRPPLRLGASLPWGPPASSQIGSSPPEPRVPHRRAMVAPAAGAKSTYVGG